MRIKEAARKTGLTEKTIRYYASTLRNAFDAIKKEVLHVTTDDLRLYLDEYQSNSDAGKTTIDNVRRILSSFFAWFDRRLHRNL